MADPRYIASNYTLAARVKEGCGNIMFAIAVVGILLFAGHFFTALQMSIIANHMTHGCEECDPE